MPNQIKILFQDYNAIEASGVIPLQEDWNLQRREKISYQTTKEGLDAADEAFHIFNAPEEILSLEQKMILEAYQGASLSVGDIVEVHPENGQPKAYLCASIGWQEATISMDDQTHKKYKPLIGPKVKFGGEACNIKVELYQDAKSVCLRLETQSGEPMITATVNIPEINTCLPSNHILIKNYSEAKGSSLISSLERAQIGKTVSAYNVSNFGAEVLEMEITHPWILDQADKKRKDALLNKTKTPVKNPIKAPTLSKAKDRGLIDPTI